MESEDTSLDAAINAAVESQTGSTQGVESGPQIGSKEPEGGGEESQETEAPREPARVDGRDETGRFTSKPEAKVTDKAETEEAVLEELTKTPARPPPGYSVQSKAAWDALPQHFRDDIAKREMEISDGMKIYAGCGQFAKEAQKNGTTLANAVRDYSAIETSLRGDFVGGIEGICQRFGINPVALTKALLDKYGGNQQPSQQQAPQQPVIDPDAIVNRVYDKVQARTGVDAVNAQIDAFAKDPAHKYFEDVRPLMAVISNYDDSLTIDQVYDQACWAHPEIRPLLMNGKATNTTKAAAAVQARSHAKAVGGPPAHGSNAPRSGNRNLSLSESIDAAVAAQLGE
jgi:hypothetical protein